MKQILLHTWTLVFMVLLLSGCTTVQPLQTRVMAAAQPSGVCRVAVLPFDNWTDEGQAGVIAQRIFHGSLVNSGAFEVRPEGDISLFRLRHRLLPGEILYPFHFEDLQEKLKIDAVVEGRLTEVGMKPGQGTVDIPVVAMQVRLYDVRSQQLILSTIHRRVGDDYRNVMHFGVVTTLTGLFDKMSDEIIADWVDKGLGHCQ